MIRLLGFEKDKKSAPVDRGYGPGNPIGAPRPKFTLGKTPNKPLKPGGPAKASGTLKSGDAPQAAIGAAPEGGNFGLPFPWPPLCMALLPDGRVISFGTDQTGAQGAQMVYDLSGRGAQG
jgi:hypothetical protein